MKYVIAIIGIVFLVGYVLNGVAAKQSSREHAQEMDRFSIELVHIAEDLETTGNTETAINAIRYQSHKAARFSDIR